MKNLKEFKEALKGLEEKLIENNFELEVEEEKFYVCAAHCFRCDRHEIYEEEIEWTYNEFFQFIEEFGLEKYCDHYDNYSLDEDLGVEAFFSFDEGEGVLNEAA